jgi:hypothetical protein
MSLKLIEGWDHMSAYIQLMQAKSWVEVKNTGAGSVTLVQGRINGQGMRLAHDLSFNFDEELRKVLPSSYTHLYLGFAFSVSKIPLGDFIIARMLSGSTQTFQVYLTSSSNIRIKNSSGTTIATGTSVITADAWHYLEFDILINGASGAIASQVDGSSDIGSTTGNFGSTGLDTIAFAINRTNGNGDTLNDYDDVYISDNSAPNNSMIGDVHVQTLYAASDGTYTSWTPNSGVNHFDRVNEHTVAPFPDNDTTYNYSSTVNAKDSYHYDQLIATTGTVYGVQTNLYCRKTDALLRQLKSLVRSGGSDFLGSAVSLAASYVDFTEIREVDPATAAAWTISGVNNAQWGVDLFT